MFSQGEYSRAPPPGLDGSAASFAPAFSPSLPRPISVRDIARGSGAAPHPHMSGPSALTSLWDAAAPTPSGQRRLVSPSTSALQPPPAPLVYAATSTLAGAPTVQDPTAWQLNSFVSLTDMSVDRMSASELYDHASRLQDEARRARGYVLGACAARDQYREEVARLKQQLHSRLLQLETLEASAGKYSDGIHKLQADVKALRGELEMADAREKALQTRLTALSYRGCDDVDAQYYKTQLAAKGSQLSELSRVNERMREELADMQRSLTRKSESRSSAAHAVEDEERAGQTQKETEELTARLRLLEAELRELKQENTALKAEVAQTHLASESQKKEDGSRYAEVVEEASRLRTLSVSLQKELEELYESLATRAPITDVAYKALLLERAALETSVQMLESNANAAAQQRAQSTANSTVEAVSLREALDAACAARAETQATLAKSEALVKELETEAALSGRANDMRKEIMVELEDSVREAAAARQLAEERAEAALADAARVRDDLAASQAAAAQAAEQHDRIVLCLREDLANAREELEQAKLEASANERAQADAVQDREESLAARLEELTERLREREDALSAQEAATLELGEALDASSTTCAKQLAVIEQLNSHLQSATAGTADLQAALDGLADERGALAEANASLEARLQQLVAEQRTKEETRQRETESASRAAADEGQHALAEQLASVREKLVAAEAAGEGDRRARQKAEVACAETMRALETLAESAHDSEDSAEKATASWKRAEAECGTLQHQLAQAQREVARLTSEWEAATANSAKIEDLRAQVATLRQEKLSLGEAVGALETSAQSLKDQQAQQNAEAAALRKELEEALTSRGVSEGTVAALKAALDRLADELASSQADAAAAEEELLLLRRKQMAQHAQAEADEGRRAARDSETTAARAQVDKLLDANSVLRAELASARAESEHRHKKLGETLAALQAAGKAHDVAAEERDAFRAASVAAEERAATSEAALERVAERADTEQSRARALLDELTAERKAAEELRHLLAQRDTDGHAMKRALADAREGHDRLSSLQAEVEELRTAHRALQQQLAASASDTTQLRQTADTAEHLRASNAALKAELVDVEKARMDGSTALDRLAMQLDAERVRVGDLTASLHAVEQANQQLQDELQDARSALLAATQALEKEKALVQQSLATRESMSAVEDEKIHLQERVAESESAVRTLESVRDALALQVADAQAASSTAASALRTCEDALSRCVSEGESQRVKQKSVEKQLAEARAAIEALARDLALAQDRGRATEDTILEFTASAAAELAHRAECTRELAELRTAVEEGKHLRQKYDRQDADLRVLTRELEDVKRQLSVERASAESQRAEREEAAKKAAQTAQAQTQAALDGLADDLQAAHLDAQANKQAADAAAEKVHGMMADLASQAETLAELSSSLKAAVSRAASQDREREQLTAELASEREKTTSLQSKLAGQRQATLEADAAVNTLATRLTAASEESEKMQRQEQERKEQLKDYDQLQTAKHQLSVEYARALARAEELAAENNNFTEQLQKLQRRLTDSEEMNTRQVSELAALRQRVEASELAASELAAREQTAAQRATALEGESGRAASDLATAHAAVEALAGQLEENSLVSTELEGVQRALADTQTELASSRSQLHAADEKLTKTTELLDAMTSRCQDTQESLQASLSHVASLQDTVAALQAKVSGLEGENVTLEERLDALQVQLDTTTALYNDRNDDITSTQSENSSLRGRLRDRRRQLKLACAHLLDSEKAFYMAVQAVRQQPIRPSHSPTSSPASTTLSLSSRDSPTSSVAADLQPVARAMEWMSTVLRGAVEADAVMLRADAEYSDDTDNELDEARRGSSRGSLEVASLDRTAIHARVLRLSQGLVAIVDERRSAAEANAKFSSSLARLEEELANATEALTSLSLQKIDAEKRADGLYDALTEATETASRAQVEYEAQMRENTESATAETIVAQRAAERAEEARRRGEERLALVEQDLEEVRAALKAAEDSVRELTTDNERLSRLLPDTHRGTAAVRALSSRDSRADGEAGADRSGRMTRLGEVDVAEQAQMLHVATMSDELMRARHRARDLEVQDASVRQTLASVQAELVIARDRAAKADALREDLEQQRSDNADLQQRYDDLLEATDVTAGGTMQELRAARQQKQLLEMELAEWKARFRDLSLARNLPRVEAAQREAAVSQQLRSITNDLGAAKALYARPSTPNPGPSAMSSGGAASGLALVESDATRATVADGPGQGVAGRRSSLTSPSAAAQEDAEHGVSTGRVEVLRARVMHLERVVKESELLNERQAAERLRDHARIDELEDNLAEKAAALREEQRRTTQYEKQVDSLTSNARALRRSSRVAGGRGSALGNLRLSPLAEGKTVGEEAAEDQQGRSDKALAAPSPVPRLPRHESAVHRVHGVTDERTSGSKHADDGSTRSSPSSPSRATSTRSRSRSSPRASTVGSRTLQSSPLTNTPARKSVAASSKSPASRKRQRD